MPCPGLWCCRVPDVLGSTLGRNPMGKSASQRRRARRQAAQADRASQPQPQPVPKPDPRPAPPIVRASRATGPVHSTPAPTDPDATQLADPIAILSRDLLRAASQVTRRISGLMSGVFQESPGSDLTADLLELDRWAATWTEAQRALYSARADDLRTDPRTAAILGYRSQGSTYEHITAQVRSVGWDSDSRAYYRARDARETLAADRLVDRRERGIEAVTGPRPDTLRAERSLGIVRQSRADGTPGAGYSTARARSGQPIKAGGGTAIPASVREEIPGLLRAAEKLAGQHARAAVAADLRAQRMWDIFRERYVQSMSIAQAYSAGTLTEDSARDLMRSHGVERLPEHETIGHLVYVQQADAHRASELAADAHVRATAYAADATIAGSTRRSRRKPEDRARPSVGSRSWEGRPTSV